MYLLLNPFLGGTYLTLSLKSHFSPTDERTYIRFTTTLIGPYTKPANLKEAGKAVGYYKKEKKKE